MRRDRNISGFLRTAFAAVFAFMSLFHGPVMTFAKASPHHAMRADHAMHAAHHGVMPDEHPSQNDASPQPTCFAFGCFVVVEPLVRLPATVFQPIGNLSPGIAPLMRAADVEPAVPPPRLQV